MTPHQKKQGGERDHLWEQREKRSFNRAGACQKTCRKTQQTDADFSLSLLWEDHNLTTRTLTWAAGVAAGWSGGRAAVLVWSASPASSSWGRKLVSWSHVRTAALSPGTHRSQHRHINPKSSHLCATPTKSINGQVLIDHHFQQALPFFGCGCKSLSIPIYKVHRHLACRAVRQVRKSEEPSLSCTATVEGFG